MSSTEVALFLTAIVVAFVGAIALVVVGLEKAFGEQLRRAWDEIDASAD